MACCGLSIGIEEVGDIVEDLRGALQSTSGPL